MLKLRLDSIEGLPADIAKEYQKEGDIYVLHTDVKYEDVTPLKNALAQEKQHRKEATEKVKALEDSVTELAARAGSAGDLEKSWKEKLTKVEQDAKAKQDALNGQLRGLLVDNVATTLASEISTAPALLIPHIQKRLDVAEGDDGKLLTRVLTPDGKVSALSVNELKSELIADKQFAPIITGSKASGGGAQGGGGGSPAGGKDFAKMTEAEKTHLYRSDRPEFDRQAAALKAKASGAA